MLIFIQNFIQIISKRNEKMKLNTLINVKAVAVCSVLALSACSSMNQQKADPVSPDGLNLVKNTRSTIAYQKEGVNFTDYDKIIISKSTVAFKKNWKRDYNNDQPGLSTRLRDKDVIKIKNDMAQLFDETFSQEMAKDAKFKVVNEASTGTLLLKPAIIDLDVNAPDIMTSVNVKSYVQDAGEATLFIEIYDAVSGEILARVVDAEEARGREQLQWANRVSNRQDAKFIIKKWAKALRTKFDEAQAK